jgi:hypothetical protein
VLTQRNSTAWKVGLVVLLAVLFLPFGVPRWVLGNDAPDASKLGAGFAQLCRDHGGTPSTTGAQRACTIEYGGRVYLMDAITTRGFDEDTARFQRQGCEEARRQQQASSARGHGPPSFVYHAVSGVCERRA